MGWPLLRLLQQQTRLLPVQEDVLLLGLLGVLPEVLLEVLLPPLLVSPLRQLLARLDLLGIPQVTLQGFRLHFSSLAWPLTHDYITSCCLIACGLPPKMEKPSLAL